MRKVKAEDDEDGRIAIGFEMPFILCVNNKYHIEATAAGKLDMPGFLPCWQKSIKRGIFHVHGMGNILPVRRLYCSDRKNQEAV